jgi:hypothetical protein
MIRTLALTWLLVSLLTGCIDPADRRPGLALSGEQPPIPSDWSFTDAHREIAVQVSTPYWIPHSVTIWCASLDGRLYLGARDPDTKNWPGWVESDPEVRIKVGDDVFDGRLQRLSDEARIAALKDAYSKKYALDAMSSGVRYWEFVPEDSSG